MIVKNLAQARLATWRTDNGVNWMAPKGPRKIARKNQVSVERELLDGSGAKVGDAVNICLNPDKPGTLAVIPQGDDGRHL